MNIGILTLPLHNNIGGVLQLYALLTFLKNNGHNVCVINRSFESRKFAIGKFFVQPIIAFRINKFIKKHITPVTKKIYMGDSLGFVDELGFDSVVVGSDQVWRIDYVKIVYEDYFLGFLKDSKTKKVSYAASFGVDKWACSSEVTNKVKELIERFSSVSVREKSGIAICKDVFGVDNVFHVLDPTLLLEKDHYINIANNANASGEEGVLTYILDSSEEKKRIVQSISSELNVNSFSVNVKRQYNKKELFRLHECIYPSVESWLAGFRDCSYVVTDSFHGMVFAIIFEKPFVAIANLNRGVDRFVSLLSMIGLGDRLIFDYDGFSKSMVSKSIDFKAVKERLSELKKESKAYLLSSI